MTKLYLAHHGVKGQKWGIQNGPPYPIEQGHGVTIKKGYKFHRLTKYDESNKKGHDYVTYLQKDNDRYKGFFGAMLQGRNNKVYDVTLEAAKDMTSPSAKKRLETFIELYKNDPMIGKELGRYHKGDWHFFTPNSTSHYEKKYSNLKGEQLTKEGYNTFVRAIGGNEYIRSAYFKALAEKGYSFVRDDLDGGKFGYMPSISFDRSNFNYLGQEQVDRKTISENWRKYGTRLKGSEKYVDR